MSDLLNLLNISVEKKPAFGQPCNHCGFCCLTDLCEVAKEKTGKIDGPCEFLESNNAGEHLCSLVVANNALQHAIGVGKGCCAETQQETFARLQAGFSN